MKVIVAALKATLVVLLMLMFFGALIVLAAWSPIVGMLFLGAVWVWFELLLDFAGVKKRPKRKKLTRGSKP